MGYTDEEWNEHVRFVDTELDRLRRENVDSRTLCGTLDRGWVRWSRERRAKQREVVRELWYRGSLNRPRSSQANFIAGNDSGEKLLRLQDPSCGIDPNDYFIVDAFWVELALVVRGMAPAIDGLSPMEASRLVREEACELAERLAQLAYAESCNLLYMLFTAYMPDAPGFLRERSDSADLTRRYGLPPAESQGTIRAIIIECLSSGTDFAEMVKKVITRWRDRPARVDEPATWQDVFNRAELKRDDDDLYWISVAEDLGLLTIEQSEAIFDAIEFAAEPAVDSAFESRPSKGASDNWQYFVDDDGDLIRIPADGTDGVGQRYWGQLGGWMANSHGCRDWAELAKDNTRYQSLDNSMVSTITAYLDQRPGGVFRMGAFWPDRSAKWSVPQALCPWP